MSSLWALLFACLLTPHLAFGGWDSTAQMYTCDTCSDHKTINLYGCNLSHFNSTIVDMQTCGDAAGLMLSRNFIKELKPDAFLGLSNLQWIDIGANGVRNVSIGAFNGLSRCVDPTRRSK